MMPAASNKTEPKTSSEAGDPTTRSYMNILDKKVRNIEKRKSRLDVIRAKKAAGDALEKEQQETLQHYDGVVACLEFARDLQKTFTANAQDLEKQQKKQMKREKQEKAAGELKRTVDILQIQGTLDSLGNESVREHFKSGKHGAVVLTEDNLNSLDEIFKLITPPAPGEASFTEELNTAAEHINSLVEGKDRAVAGSTYKELLDLLQLIIGCGYFELAREAEEEEAVGESEESVVNKGIAEATTEMEEKAEEEEEKTAIVPEALPASAETFNEAPQPEVQAPSAPVHPPSPEIEETSLPHAVVLQAAVASHEAPASPFGVEVPIPASPTLFQPPSMEPPRQPAVHKPPRPLSEIVSQVEGTFSFLQESEIDLDSPHIDPAVVVAQPMIRPPSVPSQQPPQTAIMPAGFPAPPHVDQSGGSEVQDPLSLSQQSMNSNLDYSGASQSFAQAGLSHSQNLSSGVVADAMFQPPVEETPAPPSQQQHSSHTMMGQALTSGESVAQYDLPPSIPLPPSQTSQDGAQMTGQEKKFQLNASATEFQSRTIYSPMPLNLQNLSSQPPPPQNMASQPPSQPQPSHQPNNMPESRPIPPPTTVNTDFPSSPNFAQAAGDFSQQGSSNFQGNYQRGGRGGPGYRGGPRGGRGGNNSGTAMQNGFNGRPQNGNARPGNRGGNASFQGYPPRQDYRPDGFQGFNANGFGGAQYQKRGSAGGPGYSRGGNNRGAGGMRGGVPRGGPPRGAGGNRGGMNRPGNQ